MIPDPTDVAAALHERGVALHEAGRLVAAEHACVRAQRLFERHAGKRHPDVANVLLELASISEDRGAHARALAQVRRALLILARFAGDLDADRLRVRALSQEGSVHVARGEYRAAETAYERAIAIAGRRVPPDEAAAARNGLAIVCKYTSRFAEAGRLYRRVLADLTRVHGPTHPSIATVLHNLGGLEHARGRPARALPHARRGLAIRARLLGDDHPAVALDMAALAAIVQGLKRNAEAERLYLRAIHILRRTLGKTHLEVGFNLGQFATLHQSTGRTREASALYRRALAIQSRALGRRHPLLALTLVNFAELRRAQGRSREAVVLCRRALRIYRATLGPRHADTLSCTARLASYLQPSPVTRPSVRGGASGLSRELVAVR